MNNLSHEHENPKEPLLPPREKLVEGGGAGKGATDMVKYAGELHQNSERIKLKLRYTDPSPGKASLLTQKAQEMGIPTLEPIEGKIEEVLPVSEDSIGVLQQDRPESQAKALRTAAKQKIPIMSYLLIRLSFGVLLGVRFVFQAHENELKLQGARFFDQIASLTVRNGSAQILGAQGQHEHKTLEPKFRDWFGKHFQSCLAKITADLEPESAPFEVTKDGYDTMPLLFHDSPNDWADPTTLSQTVLKNSITPIIPGQNFLLAELGGEKNGIRLHEIRLRKIDGQLSFNNTTLFNKEKLEAEEQERQQKQIEDAFRKAERRTLTRTSPVFTTD